MKIPQNFKNKKYIIILVFGVILLLIGNISVPEKKAETTFSVQTVDESKLKKTLEKIDGAGKVEVFISYKNSGTKQIAQHVTRDESGVELAPENIGDDFYVVSVETPQITGVLITATGAADEQVKNRILRGAKYALGVPYSKITVEPGD